MGKTVCLFGFVSRTNLNQNQDRHRFGSFHWNSNNSQTVFKDGFFKHGFSPFGLLYRELLFEKIRERFKKDKNFAKFLGIHKATISAWRLKKNRMPLYVLKEMGKVLDLDFNKASKNIVKTDREIAEII